MKKFGFLMVCALLASAIALPVAYAQTAQPKFKSEDEQKLYGEYYNACNVEKNETKCVDLAKQFYDKFPDSDYRKYAKDTIINALGKEFQAALAAFYGSAPDAGKWGKLLSVHDEYLKWQPENIYVKAHTALAASRSVLAGVYKDLNRTKMLTEAALQLMASTTPAEGWKDDQWKPLRESALAYGNQYLGYYELEQPTPNLENAIKFLTLSTEVKSKEALGWKDPNNYALRASIYQKQYVALSAEYRALSDDDKRGEKGKALLEKINPVIDKMIDDYARTVAVAKGESAAALAAQAKQSLDDFWKYRYKDLVGGQDALIKHFEADPLAAAPARTPSVTQADPSASAPPTTTGATKLAGSSGDPTAAKSNGKAAATKGKATAKPAAKKPAKGKRRG
jgi:hypothetical protein